MKNETQTSIELQPKKDFGKVVSLALLGLILIPSVGAMIYSTAFAKNEYVPQTPTAEQTYNSAAHTFCSAEKALASAKLLDIANGVKMDADLNALKAKRDKECAF